MAMHRRTAITTATALAAALAGCGVGGGETPEDVSLLVTDDLGARVILDRPDAEVSGEDTVVRLLQRNTDVDAASGGTFVRGVAGVEAEQDATGRTLDWVYFRNGMLASRGAAETRVEDGDHVWWDRQEYARARMGAVVGAFPAPFRVGDEVAIDLACATPDGDACAAAVRRLGQAGVPATPRALDAPITAPAGAPRMLVGTWRRIRESGAVGPLEQGPRRSGVFARLDPDGRTLTVLDRAGEATSTLRGGWGLVAAVRPTPKLAVWVVTGPDEANVRRAAAALRPDRLKGRFAVRVDGGDAVPIPEAPR
ncbi:MAG: DUF4430 domain-containing protein [Solirubrobacteraceae bacterium]|nr:DUF4430 domain-containing protein [Solirubrobacteraceae bacterium]